MGHGLTTPIQSNAISLEQTTIAGRLLRQLSLITAVQPAAIRMTFAKRITTHRSWEMSKNTRASGG